MASTNDPVLLRAEAEYWRDQHTALVNEIRSVPNYLIMGDVREIVYRHRSAWAASPVAVHDSRVSLDALRQKKKKGIS